MSNIENLINVNDFDSIKCGLRKCATKGLMYIIMMANGELMDRCDKNILISDDEEKPQKHPAIF